MVSRVVEIIKSAEDVLGHRIGPALTHTTALAPAETARVSRSTSETRAQAMAQLMDNDTGLEITVAVGVGGVPEVHPATTVLTVRWGHEVCVVVTTAVLSIGNHTVILLATTTEVVLLEVARFLIETISIEDHRLDHHTRT